MADDEEAKDKVMRNELVKKKISENGYEARLIQAQTRTTVSLE